VIPEDAVSGRVIPEDAVSGRVIPEDAVSGRVIPEDAVSGWVIPEDAISGRVVPDPFEHAERSRRVELVRQEIKRLSPAQRTAFVLRHIEQMSFREVAESMGNRESTARVLYFQAIRRLRKVLEEDE
jgi:RNA polymerase sigma factor (sigma-70 family)